MGGRELIVPVGSDHQSRHDLGTPPQHRDHVKRRLIRPVQILDHDDGRPGGSQLVSQRGKAAGGPLASCDSLGKGPIRRGRDIHEWSERARRAEAVTRPPQRPCPRALAITKLSQEGCLPDASFPRHQDKPPDSVGDFRPPAVERL